ncbi:uncharacterized protein LOC128962972 [Oppia nitens]|uniref:uncharacterized protein LOC128962972 n=1 Tax=Oppia nitens TaxID=1686743 RepID=UPI0023DC275B|nr:uncharacterized protein LOC128962972 [Oppia nitens]
MRTTWTGMRTQHNAHNGHNNLQTPINNTTVSKSMSCYELVFAFFFTTILTIVANLRAKHPQLLDQLRSCDLVAHWASYEHKLLNCSQLQTALNFNSTIKHPVVSKRSQVYRDWAVVGIALGKKRDDLGTPECTYAGRNPQSLESLPHSLLLSVSTLWIVTSGALRDAN